MLKSVDHIVLVYPIVYSVPGHYSGPFKIRTGHSHSHHIAQAALGTFDPKYFSRCKKDLGFKS